MADGEGFEPSRRLRACRFSRPVPSTTRPPILSKKLNKLVDARAATKQVRNYELAPDWRPRGFFSALAIAFAAPASRHVGVMSVPLKAHIHQLGLHVRLVP